MRVTYDGRKRASTLAERGLDFEDAYHVFAGPHWTAEDRRFAYGETRLQTVGFLAGRMVVVVWTPRDEARHVISMRKAMSANKKPFGSVLNKVDSHKVAPHEYEDAPEIDAEWFDRADAYEGPVLKRRGRPKSERPKELTTLRLSPHILDHFRAGGTGWQTRINAALEEWIKLKT